MGLILYFTYRLKYKQTKYGENMTETSSKSVLRSTTIMFLFVGLVGIWMGGCQTQEQKEIKRLIKQLQDQNKDVRIYAAFALGMIRRRSNRCRACSDTSITGSESRGTW